jgi:hypothetical protein
MSRPFRTPGEPVPRDPLVSVPVPKTSLPPRRGFLAAVSALAVAPAASSAAPDPDAELLKACAVYMAAERAWHEGHARLCDAEEVGDRDEVKRLEAVCHQAARAQEEPLALIIETPARANAGRRAKAEVARTRVQLNNTGGPMDSDEALLWSLCDDLAAAGTAP